MPRIVGEQRDVGRADTTLFASLVLPCQLNMHIFPKDYVALKTQMSGQRSAATFCSLAAAFAFYFVVCFARVVANRPRRPLFSGPPSTETRREKGGIKRASQPVIHGQF